VVDGPAAKQPGLGFGGLLRRLRDEAGLTQDELAEAARVSQRAISDLERGINATARKDTAVLLAGALGLDGQARELFVAAARGKAPAAEVLAVWRAVAPGVFAALATRALPRDIGTFTGRQAELGQLKAKLAALAAVGGVVGIHAVDGMAEIGKTTFVVHAAHQLAASFPDGQFFLPLHAHTHGQRPVNPADALASLLLTAGVPAAQIPPGLDARAARWRDHVAGKKILLVLGLTEMLRDDVDSAITTFGQAFEMYRELSDRSGQCDALNGIGYAHMLAGRYPAAAACNRQALELVGGQTNRRGQANALNDLGTVYQLTGDYPAAIASIQKALTLFRDIGHRHGEGDALTGLGVVQRLTGDYPAATATFEQAIALYRDIGERDKHASTVDELGVVCRLTGDYPAAAARHQQALSRFRALGDRAGQAWALNNLGLAQQLTGDYQLAVVSHQQALDLHRQRRDRLGQIEALNSLGELSTRTAASQQARDHHTYALALARELGVPLEEARALEGIGRSHLRGGNPAQATALLQDALTIYQRIASPAAGRVAETLHQHGFPQAPAHPARGHEPAGQRPRPLRSGEQGIDQQLPTDPAT